MIRFIVLCLFLSPFICLAQTDISKDILQHKPTPLEIIIKGRTYVTEELIAGNKQKTKELFLYLIGQEDSMEVFPFYSGEKMLIYYLLGDFDHVLNIVNGSDSLLYNKIKPPADGISKKLIQYARLRRDSIHHSIDKVLIINLQTKAFLKLKYDDLVFGDEYKINQDSLNNEADNFLREYNNSPYEKYIRSYIRFVYKKSDWGIGVEFFSGYAILTKQLSETFSNPIPIGVAFDIQYKNFSLSLRDYIGFTKTLKPIPLSPGIWPKGESSIAFIPEASIGYVILDNTHFKCAPFIGIASTNISPSATKKEEFKDLELSFTTTYTIGTSIDWKFLPKKKSGYTFPMGSDEWMIRIRYAYCLPQFDKKYSGFNGTIHSITLGLGGFSRPYRRSF
jgi:hypothetical protein